ncbi:MAG: hypothetical protein FWF51_06815 [Chitinivibrionia bacterium]|nr:hypothetical protein [Chitinivibrionia bacterium]
MKYGIIKTDIIPRTTSAFNAAAIGTTTSRTAEWRTATTTTRLTATTTWASA